MMKDIRQDGWDGTFFSTTYSFLRQIIEKTFMVGDEFEHYHKPIEELVDARQQLRDKLSALKPKLPNNPLDLIIDDLGGPSKVAEM